MIAGFASTYADAGGRLGSLIADGRYEEAVMLAHSLKGTAGQLELQEVHDASQAIEKALRNNIFDETRRLIGPLETALAPALAAAASLAAMGFTGSAIESRQFAHTDDLPSVFSELRTLIAANNFKARKLFSDRKDALASHGFTGEIAELGAMLDRLDFGGALAILDRMSPRVAPPAAGT
jgi:HPt (histidine-containing phosphotransfer) domain-containing protein